jgi:predicted TIM-barrel fold metal-dependent hydrolase
MKANVLFGVGLIAGGIQSSMKTITLEEHFVTRDFLNATGAFGEGTPEGLRQMRDRLLDVGPGRIAAMDEGGISLQVLSLAAIGIEELAAGDESAVLRGVHDEAAAAVRAHPDRFAAFATPGMKDPAAAVKELERCINTLGFKGLLLDGTIDGKFLDAPEFFPVLEAAEALGVPLYIHPAEPPKAVYDVYFSGLPGDAGHLLSIAGWGWHAETGLHLLRLIVSGVLDRLPKLQVIVGHMGEGIPYALARSSAVLSSVTKQHKRNVTETILEQVHITTSGYFTKPPFDCCREVVGLDRMLYSVDYPFSPNTRGQAFLAELNLEDEDLAAFTHTSAERLLQL